MDMKAFVLTILVACGLLVGAGGLEAGTTIPGGDIYGATWD